MGKDLSKTHSLVSYKPTGRDWGNKVPETRKGDVIINDAWEGPLKSGEQGQYFRCVWKLRSS